MTEDNSTVWSRWASRYDAAVVSGHPMYSRYAELLDAVLETAGIAAGMEVLDIGAGTGNLADKCLSRGAIVTAVDPSEDMLAIAEKKLAPKVEGRLHLARSDDPFIDSGFPDNRFDVVVSTYAFHHVPRPMHSVALREMSRILRPGGLWVIGDLAFLNEKAEREALQQYRWLEAEDFALIEVLRDNVFQSGPHFECKQFAPVTWLLWSRSSGRGGADHAESR